MAGVRGRAEGGRDRRKRNKFGAAGGVERGRKELERKELEDKFGNGDDLKSVSSDRENAG